MKPLLLTLLLLPVLGSALPDPAAADDDCVSVRGYARQDGTTVNGYERNAPGRTGCAPGPDDDGFMRRARGEHGGSRFPVMPLDQEYPAPVFGGDEIRGSRSLHHSFGTNPCYMIPRNFPSWQYDRNLVRFMKDACPGFENVRLLGQ